MAEKDVEAWIRQLQAEAAVRGKDWLQQQMLWLLPQPPAPPSPKSTRRSRPATRLSPSTSPARRASTSPGSQRQMFFSYYFSNEPSSQHHKERLERTCFGGSSGLSCPDTPLEQRGVSVTVGSNTDGPLGEKDVPAVQEVSDFAKGSTYVCFEGPLGAHIKSEVKEKM
ncbi:hypothetical protein XELAEV_18012474mg [Xenopus laevis]|uniref:Uncharacterized protein n=1 Tax=Xenopus laevis TaxID=8355 RepID=A0A974DML7_XENLA|nr:hypothetical protein XELAEV_18012474mg [Xenopus laevis]